MARIRTVKIGFFRNEHLAIFSPFHRLLFQGLWLLADKEGRLEDRPKRIQADLFPFDPVLDVNAMLTELADGPDPFIERYQVDGRRYIAVLNFGVHQRPNHKEPDSLIPGPCSSDALTPPDLPGISGDGPPGREGNGSREGEGNGVRVKPRPLLSPSDLREAWNEYTSAPIPKCEELTVKRRQSAHTRLQEAALDVWRVVIGRINASPFCRGDNDRGWVATFDWLLKPDTRVRVLEGKYDDRRKVTPKIRTVEIRDWGEECKRLHDSRCGNPTMHDARMDAGWTPKVVAS